MEALQILNQKGAFQVVVKSNSYYLQLVNLASPPLEKLSDFALGNNGAGLGMPKFGMHPTEGQLFLQRLFS